MTFDRTPISVTEAQQKIAPCIKEGKIESVPLLESVGRSLAEDVSTTYPIPHFRRSAMDGFAIKATDTSRVASDSPVKLSVDENIPAGSVPAKKVGSGTCARIMTGAMVPEGANAVVRLEDTDNGQGETAIFTELGAGVNVTEIGAEMAKDTPLIQPGKRIGSGDAAVLAMFGFTHVKVYQEPKVAVLSTGSELLNPEDPLEPGKIRNSNTYMLAAQIKSAGGVPTIIDSVPDDAELDRQKVFAAFEDADLVVTTGGVSVGDYDILVDLFDTWDGEMLFNKLQMRPGSVTTAGVRDGQLLFALSGNPGACFAGFELLARPVLNGMLGKKEIYLPEFSAFLSQDFTNKGSDPRYVRGEYVFEEGQVYVHQVGEDKSSVVTSIKDTDVLIEIPPGPVTLTAGDLVSVLQLQVIR